MNASVVRCRVSIVLYVVGFIACIAFTGCSDDGDDKGNSGADASGDTGVGGDCTRDSDCGSNQFCDLPSIGFATVPKDVGCFTACQASCGLDDFSCVSTCFDDCNVTCADVCFDDPDCESDCEEEFGGGGTGGDATDTGSGTPDAGSTPRGECRTRQSTSDATDSSTGTDIDWAGTWSIRVDYSVSCEVSLSSPNTGSNTHSETGVVTINGSSATAVFANQSEYTMSGPASAQRLTLSGQFPIRDYSGDVVRGVVQSKNTITVVLDDITDSNTASGRIEGRFEGKFGSDCTISDGGTAELTR